MLGVGAAQAANDGELCHALNGLHKGVNLQPPFLSETRELSPQFIRSSLRFTFVADEFVSEL